MFLNVFHIFSQVSSASCYASCYVFYNYSFMAFRKINCMHILLNSCFLVVSMQVRARIFSFFKFNLILHIQGFQLWIFSHFSHFLCFVFITFATFLLTFLFFFMTLLDTCHVSFQTFILFHNVSQHLLRLIQSFYFVSQCFLVFG